MKAKPLKVVAAELVAAIDTPGGVDFYNHLYGGSNGTGKKRLAQLRAIIEKAAK